MDIELDMEVVSSDGETLGRASRVILNPATATVDRVVIERGFLLTESVEAPAALLRSDQGGVLTLGMTAAEAKKLPRYDESRYVGTPEGIAAPFGFPAGGVLWPAGAPAVAAPPAAAPYGQGVYPVAPLVEPFVSAGETPDSPEEGAILKELDLSNAVIDEGSDVISSDGEKVGEVHGLVFDAGTGRPTALRVRQGFLFRKDVEIPAEAIGSVDDRVIYLKVDKERLEQWSRDDTVLLF